MAWGMVAVIQLLLFMQCLLKAARIVCEVVSLLSGIASPFVNGVILSNSIVFII